jgi:hypothetical protein
LQFFGFDATRRSPETMKKYSGDRHAASGPENSLF